MTRDSEGKIFIGQSIVQKLMIPYIKPMSIQKRVVCGCETCVSADTLQSSLNYWRLKNIKWLEFIALNRSRSQSAIPFNRRVEAYKEEILFDDELIHMKASQAAYSMFCSFMENSLKLPNRDCAIGTKCYTK